MVIGFLCVDVEYKVDTSHTLGLSQIEKEIWNFSSREVIYYGR